MARRIDADALHRKVKMETNPYGKPTIDVMEKLVELIAQKVCYTWSESCDEWMPHDCGKCYANDCHISEVADHLISNGVTVQEWISVDDRLPEKDLPKDTKKKMIRCLVYTDKGTIKPCVRQRWEVNGKLVPWQWNKDLFAKPTHWMYYPQPPKGE